MGVSVQTKLLNEDIEFFDVRCGKFDIYGLLDAYDENEYFHRIPFDVAEKTSQTVKALNCNTSGGRVRFRTDSEYVAINMEYLSEWKPGVGNMNDIGKSGFDIYTYIDGKPIYSARSIRGPCTERDLRLLSALKHERSVSFLSIFRFTTAVKGFT